MDHPEKSSPRAELERRVAEVTQTLEELRAELQREIEREQHQEIDRLDQFVEAAHFKFSDLRHYWQSLVQDWRNGAK